ncbi:hypothetical protein SeLEV6574_g03864 [Synchytrium endobioticum]|uniref:Uncharacterized protein n=1 Tax=Synchytrium endobioticum TaxID=286115 RepID=A0A507D2E0_9FUNG|nr:hypothetical protein SeLEV6574_g03864 [Synchytrium endobioticum]
MPIPRIAVLACSMVLLCTLPVRSQPDADPDAYWGGVFRRDAETMHLYMKGLYAGFHALARRWAEFDTYILEYPHACLMADPEIQDMIGGITFVIADYRTPWQEFPNESDMIVRPGWYRHYKDLYDHYFRLIRDVGRNLEMLNRLPVSQTIAMITFSTSSTRVPVKRTTSTNGSHGNQFPSSLKFHRYPIGSTTPSRALLRQVPTYSDQPKHPLW